MNKKDLIAHIAAEHNLTKESVRLVIDSLVATTTAVLKKGDTLQLVGFGKFSVKQHKERPSRNPRTGEAIVIKAKRAAKFTPGKDLAEAIR